MAGINEQVRSLYIYIPVNQENLTAILFWPFWWKNKTFAEVAKI